MSARQIIAEYMPDADRQPYRPNIENVVQVDKATGRVLWRGTEEEFFSFSHRDRVDPRSDRWKEELGTTGKLDLKDGTELQIA